MSNQRVLLQPAYVLHARAYRDTSAIVEILSPNHGRVGLVAKGIKRPSSKLKGLLQPFVPLLVSWSGKGELFTLTGAEAQGRAMALKQKTLACGIYMNELVMRLVPRHEVQIELFSGYDQAIRALESVDRDDLTASLDWVLRRFEISLLANLGYGLSLDREAVTGSGVDPGATYDYQLEAGPVRLPESSEQPPYGIAVSGKTLLALSGISSSPTSVAQRNRDPEISRQSKQLLRFVLQQYLGDKPLMSRQLFMGKNTMTSKTVGQQESENHGQH
jgi:DNA repair protein RecO (recombination protein O)